MGALIKANKGEAGRALIKLKGDEIAPKTHGDTLIQMQYL